jgi:hypothetical protein
MSANVPCEAGPAAADSPSPPIRLCPICTRELPLRAQKCLSCGEYVNWQGRLSSAKGILALAGTLTTLVAGIFGINAMWPRGSHTEVVKVDPSDDSTRLVIHVKNTGKKDARVHRDFTVSLTEPNILEFGSLMLLKPEAWIVVRPDEPRRSNSRSPTSRCYPPSIVRISQTTSAAKRCW